MREIIRRVTRALLAYGVTVAVFLAIRQAIGSEREVVEVAVMALVVPLTGLLAPLFDRSGRRGWGSLAMAFLYVALGCTWLVVQSIRIWEGIGAGKLLLTGENYVTWGESPVGFGLLALPHVLILVLGLALAWLGVHEFRQWRETCRLTRPLANR